MMKKKKMKKEWSVQSGGEEGAALSPGEFYLLHPPKVWCPGSQWVFLAAFWAVRQIGEIQLTVTAPCDEQLERKASLVPNDHSQPLHGEFKLLPPDCHFSVPKGKTKPLEQLCSLSHCKAE